jgi:hypothetical protein
MLSTTSPKKQIPSSHRHIRLCISVALLAFMVLAGNVTTASAAGSEAGASVYKANPKPPTDGLIGTNYTPAYAVNQVQFWHDFRADVVERELAAAVKYFGISTLRVYLHDINFFQEKKVLMANIEKFLVICAKHKIRPGFVFFDSCHRDKGIYLSKPTKPVAGFHNGRWAQSPQARDIDRTNVDKFKPYVQEIIKAYRTDKRVLFWEVHNEPKKKDKYRDELKRAGYAWAKAVKPTQPVLNCEHSTLGWTAWGDCTVTDIVDAHLYNNDHGHLNKLAEQNIKKGTVFTEAGARAKGIVSNYGGPIDMMYWLKQRKRSDKSTPGMYLCWELMVGNSNCRWMWGEKPGSPEPEIPWCGLLWPDYTPVSLAECEAIRSYVTGKPQAMLFDDFENHSAKKWKAAGGIKLSAKNFVTLPASVKASAGDAKWGDYCFEGQVAIPPQEGDGKAGMAGLLFRTSKLSADLSQTKSYSVMFNGDLLVLYKVVAGKWRELARYDLGALKNRIKPNRWNMIRIAAAGPRIRVWFNRMHPSSDTKSGLRIDYVDKDKPILTGGVGLITRGATASFDNIVVLPLDALPGDASKKAGPGL